MHAELTRLKRQHARTEADRRKCSAKYNNLLDDLSMSSDELIRELAYYKRKTDDLETEIDNERKTMQNTLKVLEDKHDDIIAEKNDMGARIDELEAKLEEKRKRSRELEDDLEAIIREKEDAEQAYREQELKTARLLNEHTGLNLKVQDMYTKQAKYKKQIRSMHSSRDIRRDENFSKEAISKAMKKIDSYYDDRSHNEDDYK